MIERQIFMRADMVKATQNNKKMQARRVIEDPDHFACLTGDCGHTKQVDCDNFMASQCPYGRAGDILLVRDTWDCVWSSKGTLEITGIRTSKLQKISSHDAYWEGVEDCDICGHDDCFYGDHGYICSFEVTWDQHNKNPEHTWKKDPMVWVIDFRRLI